MMMMNFLPGFVTGILYLLIGLPTMVSAVETWDWFEQRMPERAMPALASLLIWPVFLLAVFIAEALSRGGKRKTKTA